MPLSKPTRECAYGLRVSKNCREEWFRCESAEALARAVAARAGQNNRRGSWHWDAHGDLGPIFSVSEDGCTLHWLHGYSEHVGRNLWGSIQVRRTDWVTYEAFAPNGRLLKIEPLLKVGNSLNLAAQCFRGWRIANLNYCGHGPVPGVRKRRGGGGWYRRVRTMSERRLNALVLFEEGEFAARSSRCGRGLPSSWDDIHRGHERSWKNQHKGRKAWNRDGHADGFADFLLKRMLNGDRGET